MRDGGGGTVKFFAQSFAQLQTLVISLSVPGEGFQFPVPPGWESGSWQRGAEQEAVVEEVCQLSPPGRGCPPPNSEPTREVVVGLKGAKSRSQEPTAGALCGGLGPGLTEGQGTEQQDTTVEEAFPGREGTSQGGPKSWPVLLSSITGPQRGSFPTPLHPSSLQGGSDHLLC